MIITYDHVLNLSYENYENICPRFPEISNLDVVKTAFIAAHIS